MLIPEKRKSSPDKVMLGTVNARGSFAHRRFCTGFAKRVDLTSCASRNLSNVWILQPGIREDSISKYCGPDVPPRKYEVMQTVCVVVERC